MDEPQNIPPIPEPQGPQPFPPVETPQQPSARIDARTMVGLGVLIVLIAGALWYSGLFSVDVERTPAADVSPEVSAADSVLTAQCVGVSSPSVLLSWTPAEDMELNAILRSTGDDDPQVIFSEEGPAFETFLFTDTSVRANTSYNYEVRTGLRSKSNNVLITTSSDQCGSQ